ncbi:MAG: hypothetical protein ACI4LS_07750 [Treponema sp.]
MEFLKLRKRLNKKIFFIFFLCSLTFSIFAKENTGMGDSHPVDMLKVLGLFTEASDPNSYTNFKALEPLTSKINYYIDHFYEEPDAYYYYGWDKEKKRIKENMKFIKDGWKRDFNYFTWDWKVYSHRFLNHWGFDMDVDLDSEGGPTKYQYQDLLLELFNDKYLKYVDSDPERAKNEWYRFIKFLKSAQADINRDLIQCVKQYLGIQSTQDARDVAAILYYTHLLGDLAVHEGNDTGKSVLEMYKIKRNIGIHVQNLSKKNFAAYEMYKKHLNGIKTSNEKEYATDFINILIKDVSVIIQSNFSAQFESKGLHVPENIELLDAA